MEKIGFQKKPYKLEICSGCGWKNEIVYVTEYGLGFCQECIDNKTVMVN
jgi:hypothetical protein